MVLFATYGTEGTTSTTWNIHLHAWVFEPESEHFFNRQLIQQLSHLLDLPDHSEQRTRFEHRIGPFLVDNERDKHFSVQTDSRLFNIGPSTANGHIRHTLVLPRQHTRWVKFRVTERPHASASVELIPPTGISVISDIDDTIKISAVTDKTQLLRNTFLNPYQAVPGMAQRYQQWQQQGFSFHYLSASPWPLYRALQGFLTTHHFPPGSFHLRHLRLKDGTFFNLFENTKTYKLKHIERILADFPKRTFILVGDSGEADAEIYAHIARQYPQYIRHIYIRTINNTPTSSTRYKAVFKGLPETLWTVFSDPNRLNSLQ